MTCCVYLIAQQDFEDIIDRLINLLALDMCSSDVLPIMDIVLAFRPFSSINPGVFHLALDIFGILAIALCVLLGEVARFGYATGEDSLFLGRTLASKRGVGAFVV